MCPSLSAQLILQRQIFTSFKWCFLSARTAWTGTLRFWSCESVNLVVCFHPSEEPRTAGVGEGASSPPARGKDSAFLHWNLKEVMRYMGCGVAPLISRSKCFSECTITRNLQIHSFPALKTSFIPSSASHYDNPVLQNSEKEHECAFGNLPTRKDLTISFSTR